LSSSNDSNRAYAEEPVGLAPDVIVTTGAAQTGAVQQRTQTIPIVFLQVGDPVASGVPSLNRPEPDATIDCVVPLWRPRASQYTR